MVNVFHLRAGRCFYWEKLSRILNGKIIKITLYAVGLRPSYYNPASVCACMCVQCLYVCTVLVCVYSVCMCVQCLYVCTVLVCVYSVCMCVQCLYVCTVFVCVYSVCMCVQCLYVCTVLVCVYSRRFASRAPN